MQIPQPKENWFKFPNFIADNLDKLSGNESKIIIFIIRKTIGYSDPNCKFSNTYLSTKLNMSKQTVIDCKRSLIEKGLIYDAGVSSDDGSSLFCVNFEPDQASQEFRPQSNNLTTPVQNLDQPSLKNRLPPVQNLDPLKDNTSKTIQKDNTSKKVKILSDEIIVCLKENFGAKIKIHIPTLSEIENTIKDFDTPIQDLTEKIKQLKQLYQTDFYVSKNLHPTPESLIKSWNKLHNIKAESKPIGVFIDKRTPEQIAEFERKIKEESKIEMEESRRKGYEARGWKYEKAAA